jgi:hypothetical protein
VLSRPAGNPVASRAIAGIDPSTRLRSLVTTRIFSGFGYTRAT